MALPDELLEITAGAGKLLAVSDVETDGLLKGMSGGGDIPPMSTVHSATVEILDPSTLEIVESLTWSPDGGTVEYEGQTFKSRPIKEYPEYMNDRVGCVVGHNFISFDNRAIQSVYPKYRPPVTLDTLPMCKMVWPADVLIVPDMKRFRAGNMPAKYLKRQSLGAWGYRMGNYKGEYDGGWLEWTPWMHSYMAQDGKVNVDLFKLICRRMGWLDNPEGATYTWPYLPTWIEMQMAAIITEQEAAGVGFDKAAAVALSQDLKNQQAKLTEKLREVFGPWWAPKLTTKQGVKVTTKDAVRVRKDQPTIQSKALAIEVDERYKALKGKKAPKTHYGPGGKRYQIDVPLRGLKALPHRTHRVQPGQQAPPRRPASSASSSGSPTSTPRTDSLKWTRRSSRASPHPSSRRPSGKPCWTTSSYPRRWASLRTARNHGWST